MYIIENEYGAFLKMVRDTDFTDFDVQAYVDGMLDADKAYKIKCAIQNNPLLQERYSQLQKQKNLLQRWWNSKQKH